MRILAEFSLLSRLEEHLLCDLLSQGSVQMYREVMVMDMEWMEESEGKKLVWQPRIMYLERWSQHCVWKKEGEKEMG